MKQWLRVLPFPILIFAVLTFLDYAEEPGGIHWVANILQSAGLGAIGCLGQFLIHRNILREEEPEDSDGCIGCGKPESGTQL